MKLPNQTITHNQDTTNFSSLYLIEVGTACQPGAKCGLLYTYILFANTPKQAIELFKINCRKLIDAKLIELGNSDDWSNRYMYSDTKIQNILNYIEKGWYEVSEVDKNRAIPVSYFDDWRDNTK